MTAEKPGVVESHRYQVPTVVTNDYDLIKGPMRSAAEYFIKTWNPTACPHFVTKLTFSAGFCELLRGLRKINGHQKLRYPKSVMALTFAIYCTTFGKNSITRSLLMFRSLTHYFRMSGSERGRLNEWVRERTDEMERNSYSVRETQKHSNELFFWK